MENEVVNKPKHHNGVGKIILKIILVIIVIVGLVWFFHGLWRNWKIYRIKDWPKSQATIITSGVAQVNGCVMGDNIIDPDQLGLVVTGNNKFVPKIRYSYTVRGMQYYSNSFQYSGDETFGPVEIKSMMNFMKPGDKISVFVNPDDPNESYVRNGANNYWGIIFGAIIILLALYFAVRSSKKRTASKHKKSTQYNGVGSPDTPNLSDYEMAKSQKVEVNKYKTYMDNPYRNKINNRY